VDDVLAGAWLLLPAAAHIWYVWKTRKDK